MQSEVPYKKVFQEFQKSHISKRDLRRKLSEKLLIKRNRMKKICYNGTVEIQDRVLKVYTFAQKRALAERGFV